MRRALAAVRDSTLFGLPAGPDGGIPVGGAAWLDWLEAPETSSFRFEHGREGFTARRERRPGGRYWYAYRKCAGRLHKAYLGRSAELTPDRLRAVGATLARVDGGVPVAEAHVVPEPTPVRRHNLPLQPTSFVGREQALADVRRLLETARLLTLTGPGGAGKTRLALEVAASVSDAYSDGVWLVELAPLADAQLVPQAVASVLGVREQQGESLLAVLAATLRPRQLFLVLDNCEHLLSACSELADTLLRACPDLVILATSRAVLEVEGETTWRVPPLAVPGVNDRQSVDVLVRSEAVRLFVERARAALPEFVLDERNGPAVAALCRRLDGLPLAIELAAARVRALALEQITDRLDHALAVLVTGPRTAPARLQTMRAALDWSYALLGEPERRLFERVSVFAGGWNLEAAEAVGVGDGIEASDVLDGLSRLVDQSMVIAEPSADKATVRFRLLEPLRQYAAERLESRGDVEAVRRRHAAYYTHLVHQLGFNWSGRDLARLAGLEAEHDNARAALRWMIDRGEVESALQLAGDAAYYWQQHGYASEGRAWLSEILALPGAANTAARALALIYASTLVAEQGEYVTARPLLEEALNISRELGDGPTLAFALFRAAQLSWFRREFAAARQFADEGVSVGRALGLRNLEGINLWQSAQATHDLEEPGAQALAERAVAIFTEVENPTMLGCALTTLAQVHLARGDLATARRLVDRAVATHPPELQGVAQMFSNVNLGWVATVQGDLMTAHAALVVALRMACDALGARARLVTPLEGLAQLAAAAGQPVRALRLAGAAARLRSEYATPPTPTEVRQLQRWLTQARAALSQRDADAAWTMGEQLTPEQAIREALALETKSTPRWRADPLTRREREVALLVANGADTRDIAEQLVISQNTARVHIERILSKLGLHSRAQLAAWTVQRAFAPRSVD